MSFEIEFEPARQGEACGCCGEVTTSLVRYVLEDGRPRAIATICYTAAHPEVPADAIFGLGAFGEGSCHDDRVAFALWLSPAGVGLVDATSERWPGSEVLGRKLTREEGLVHPEKGLLFELVDQLYLGDPDLRAFLGLGEPPACRESHP